MQIPPTFVKTQLLKYLFYPPHFRFYGENDDSTMLSPLAAVTLALALTSVHASVCTIPVLTTPSPHVPLAQTSGSSERVTLVTSTGRGTRHDPLLLTITTPSVGDTWVMILCAAIQLM